MSYSFNVRAANKAEAAAKVANALDTVVCSQPIHAADQEQAQAAVNSFLALVQDDATQDVNVSVNGSCWGDVQGFRGVSFNVSIGLSAKETPNVD